MDPCWNDVRRYAQAVLSVILLSLGTMGCPEEDEPIAEGGDVLTDSLTPPQWDGADGTADDALAGDGATAATAPTAIITIPKDGAIYEWGQTVVLTGFVSDERDQPSQLHSFWASDLQGPLGELTPDQNGMSRLELPGLVAGTHTITLTVDNPATDLQGTATVTLVVKPDLDAPIVTIEPQSADTTVTLLAVVAANRDPTSAHEDPQYSYAWYRNGEEMGITGTTVGAAQTVKGDTWQVRVIATIGDWQSSEGTAQVLIDNAVPACQNATLAPNEGTVGTSFECECIDRSDADPGDPVLDRCTFEANGELLGEENGPCTLDGDVAKKGMTLSCALAPGDGEDLGEPVDSNGALVLNSAPTTPVVALEPAAGNALTTFDCTVTLGSTDADTDDVEYLRSWLVNGQAVGGAVEGQVKAQDLTNPMTGKPARHGDSIACRVTASDGEDPSAPGLSPEVVLANASPQGGEVVVTPTFPTSAQSVTCNASGALDPDGVEVSWTYAWLVSGAPVAGQTGKVLPPGSFDKGDTITCMATPADGFTAGATLTSVPVTVVNTLPSLSGATVAADPSPSVCATLTCQAAGLHDPDLADAQSLTLTYRWERNGASIPGASDAVLGGVELLPGDQLVCFVRPTDGTTDPATGAAVYGGEVASGATEIVNSWPTLAGIAVTPANAAPGDTLLCNSWGLTDPECLDNVVVNYEWLVDNQVVDGESAPTFLTNGLADGALVRCRATPTDGYVEGPTQVSEYVTMKALAEGAPKVAVEAIEDGYKCQVVENSPPGDAALTWYWAVDEGAEFEQAQVLSSDAVEVVACTRLRCRLVVDATLESNVAELQTPLGPGCQTSGPCGTATCHPLGGCLVTATPGACDDGDACTFQDKCADGLCAGTALTCDDGSPCTADLCDPGKGCVHAPADGTTCDDGDACTQADVCAAGQCKGQNSCQCASNLDCDAGNACLQAACVDSKCVYIELSVACDDGSSCTVGDTCQGGVCVGGSETPCTTWYLDQDGDGYGADESVCVCEQAVATKFTAPVSGDCDDIDPAVHPGASEVCDGIDNDCAGGTDAQDSGLELMSCELQKGACDGAQKPASACQDGAWQPCVPGDYAAHALQYEGTSEQSCDGLDNNCDGLVDEAFKVGTGCDGADADTCHNGVITCDPADSMATLCDETDAANAKEVCDGLDNDCNGLIDSDDPTMVTIGCEKTAGVCAGASKPTSLCVGGAWLACAADHYSGFSPAYQIGAETSCDGLDNDCDGQVDEKLAPPTATKTAGVCAGLTQVCSGPAGWVDPDYSAALSAYQGDEQTCDGLDNDCDGQVDEKLAAPAADKGAGLCAGLTKVCAGSSGWIEPQYGAVVGGFESLEDTCDGLDNDCDGEVDESLVAPTADKVHGVCTGLVKACGGAKGWIEPSYAAKAAGYEAVEASCDGIDNDCDGVADNGLVAPAATLTQGLCAGLKKSCGGPNGWQDPDYAAVVGSEWQAVEESCDGLDNDCNGTVDESFKIGVACDGDDVDSCANGVLVCDPKSVLGTLCDETNSENAIEICDGMDNDCDGEVDEVSCQPVDLDEVLGDYHDAIALDGEANGDAYDTTASGTLLIGPFGSVPVVGWLKKTAGEPAIWCFQATELDRDLAVANFAGLHLKVCKGTDGTIALEVLSGTISHGGETAAVVGAMATEDPWTLTLAVGGFEYLGVVPGSLDLGWDGQTSACLTGDGQIGVFPGPLTDVAIDACALGVPGDAPEVDHLDVTADVALPPLGVVNAQLTYQGIEDGWRTWVITGSAAGQQSLGANGQVALSGGKLNLTLLQDAQTGAPAALGGGLTVSASAANTLPPTLVEAAVLSYDFSGGMQVPKSKLVVAEWAALKLTMSSGAGAWLMLPAGTVQEEGRYRLPNGAVVLTNGALDLPDHAFPNASSTPDGKFLSPAVDDVQFQSPWPFPDPEKYELPAGAALAEDGSIVVNDGELWAYYKYTDLPAHLALPIGVYALPNGTVLVDPKVFQVPFDGLPAATIILPALVGELPADDLTQNHWGPEGGGLLLPSGAVVALPGLGNADVSGGVLTADGDIHAADGGLYNFHPAVGTYEHVPPGEGPCASTTQDSWHLELNLPATSTVTVANDTTLANASIGLRAESCSDGAPIVVGELPPLPIPDASHPLKLTFSGAFDAAGNLKGVVSLTKGAVWQPFEPLGLSVAVGAITGRFTRDADHHGEDAYRSELTIVATLADPNDEKGVELVEGLLWFKGTLTLDLWSAKESTEWVGESEAEGLLTIAGVGQVVVEGDVDYSQVPPVLTLGGNVAVEGEDGESTVTGEVDVSVSKDPVTGEPSAGEVEVDCSPPPGCTGDACKLPANCTCATNAACDDGNPCTQPQCIAGQCVYTNVDVPCDDGNSCTTQSVCINGVCLGKNEAPCTTYYKDEDQDGFGTTETVCVCTQASGTAFTANVPGDCNDFDPAIKPGAVEVCDAIDNDCNNKTDASDPALVLQACEKQAGPCQGSLKAPKLCVLGAWEECGKTTYAAIAPTYEFGVEVSCDGVDNNCDGQIDETFKIGQGCDGADADSCKNGIFECDPLTVTKAVCVEPEEGEPVNEICDGVDNDCDTLVDAADPDLMMAPCEQQGAVCAGAMTTAALCVDGKWASCSAPHYQAASSFYQEAESACDGFDNDCDGQVDEDLTGPLALQQAGVCAGAHKVCGGTQGFVEPDFAQVVDGYEADETLCDGLDNDCNGQVDDELVAPDATLAQGVCVGQKRVCGGTDGWQEPNYGAIANFEAIEDSCDGIDNDCDGQIDEGVVAPLADKQQGVCAGVRKLCDGNGGFLEPNYATTALGYQQVETTCDGADNDCDGQVDNNLTAPPAAKDVGVCANKTKVCAGTGGWAEPDYTLLEGYSADELCDGLDNNCNGSYDEGLKIGMACDGDDADNCLNGVYACDAGTKFCDESAAAEAIEVCDEQDNNCDGQIDEGLTCNPVDVSDEIGDDFGSGIAVDGNVAGDKFDVPASGTMVVGPFGEVPVTGFMKKASPVTWCFTAVDLAYEFAFFQLSEFGFDICKDQGGEISLEVRPGAKITIEGNEMGVSGQLDSLDPWQITFDFDNVEFLGISLKQFVLIYDEDAKTFCLEVTSSLSVFPESYLTVKVDACASGVPGANPALMHAQLLAEAQVPPLGDLTLKIGYEGATDEVRTWTLDAAVVGPEPILGFLSMDEVNLDMTLLTKVVDGAPQQLSGSLQLLQVKLGDLIGPIDIDTGNLTYSFDGKLRVPKMPKLAIPEFTGPKLTLPNIDLSLPHVEWPTGTVPSLGRLKLPNGSFALPNGVLELPKFSFPPKALLPNGKFSLPSFGTPDFSLGSWKLPDPGSIGLPDLSELLPNGDIFVDGKLFWSFRVAFDLPDGISLPDGLFPMPNGSLLIDKLKFNIPWPTLPEGAFAIPRVDTSLLPAGFKWTGWELPEGGILLPSGFEIELPGLPDLGAINLSGGIILPNGDIRLPDGKLFRFLSGSYQKPTLPQVQPCAIGAASWLVDFAFPDQDGVELSFGGDFASLSNVEIDMRSSGCTAGVGLSAEWEIPFPASSPLALTLGGQLDTDKNFNVAVSLQDGTTWAPLADLGVNLTFDALSGRFQRWTSYEDTGLWRIEGEIETSIGGPTEKGFELVPGKVWLTGALEADIWATELGGWDGNFFVRGSIEVEPIGKLSVSGKYVAANGEAPATLTLKGNTALQFPAGVRVNADVTVVVTKGAAGVEVQTVDFEAEGAVDPFGQMTFSGQYDAAAGSLCLQSEGQVQLGGIDFKGEICWPVEDGKLGTPTVTGEVSFEIPGITEPVVFKGAFEPLFDADSGDKTNRLSTEVLAKFDVFPGGKSIDVTGTASLIGLGSDGTCEAADATCGGCAEGEVCNAGACGATGACGDCAAGAVCVERPVSLEKVSLTASMSLGPFDPIECTFSYGGPGETSVITWQASCAGDGAVSLGFAELSNPKVNVLFVQNPGPPVTPKFMDADLELCVKIGWLGFDECISTGRLTFSFDGNLRMPKLSGFSMPEWSLPSLKLPDLDVGLPSFPDLALEFPDLSLPNLNLPQLTLPKGTIPKFGMFQLPNFGFTLPNGMISLPKFSFPNVAFKPTLPEFSLPKFPSISFGEIPGLPKLAWKLPSGFGLPDGIHLDIDGDLWLNGKLWFSLRVAMDMPEWLGLPDGIFALPNGLILINKLKFKVPFGNLPFGAIVLPKFDPLKFPTGLEFKGWKLDLGGILLPSGFKLTLPGLPDLGEIDLSNGILLPNGDILDWTGIHFKWDGLGYLKQKITLESACAELVGDASWSANLSPPADTKFTFGAGDTSPVQLSEMQLDLRFADCAGGVGVSGKWAIDFPKGAGLQMITSGRVDTAKNMQIAVSIEEGTTWQPLLDIGSDLGFETLSGSFERQADFNSTGKWRMDGELDLEITGDDPDKGAELVEGTLWLKGAISATVWANQPDAGQPTDWQGEFKVRGTITMEPFGTIHVFGEYESGPNAKLTLGGQLMLEFPGGVAINADVTVRLEKDPATGKMTLVAVDFSAHAEVDPFGAMDFSGQYGDAQLCLQAALDVGIANTSFSGEICWTEEDGKLVLPQVMITITIDVPGVGPIVLTGEYESLLNEADQSITTRLCAEVKTGTAEEPKLELFPGSPPIAISGNACVTGLGADGVCALPCATPCAAGNVCNSASGQCEKEGSCGVCGAGEVCVDQPLKLENVNVSAELELPPLGTVTVAFEYKGPNDAGEITWKGTAGASGPVDVAGFVIFSDFTLDLTFVQQDGTPVTPKYLSAQLIIWVEITSILPKTKLDTGLLTYSFDGLLRVPSLPKFPKPSFAAPNLKLPGFDLSLPQLTFPKGTIPKFGKLKLPNGTFALPNGSLSLPKFHFPPASLIPDGKFELPKLPDIDFSLGSWQLPVSWGFPEGVHLFPDGLLKFNGEIFWDWRAALEIPDWLQLPDGVFVLPNGLLVFDKLQWNLPWPSLPIGSIVLPKVPLPDLLPLGQLFKGWDLEFGGILLPFGTALELPGLSGIFDLSGGILLPNGDITLFTGEWFKFDPTLGTYAKLELTLADLCPPGIGSWMVDLRMPEGSELALGGPVSFADGRVDIRGSGCAGGIGVSGTWNIDFPDEENGLSLMTSGRVDTDKNFEVSVGLSEGSAWQPMKNLGSDLTIQTLTGRFERWANYAETGKWRVEGELEMAIDGPDERGFELVENTVWLKGAIYALIWATQPDPPDPTKWEGIFKVRGTVHVEPVGYVHVEGTYKHTDPPELTLTGKTVLEFPGGVRVTAEIVVVVVRDEITQTMRVDELHFKATAEVEPFGIMTFEGDYGLMSFCVVPDETCVVGGAK